MLRSVDSAASQPDEMVAPLAGEQPAAGVSGGIAEPAKEQPEFANEFWRKAGGEACGLTAAEFAAVLAAVGAKHNYGLPPGAAADEGRRAAFFHSLHLNELALAHACALGREPAWERLVAAYRSALVQAGAAIAGSAALGSELADSLYGELYGLRRAEGERRSPLATYSGRGSLLGWLRATLVQRYRDHLRRTRREAPLDDFDSPAPEAAAAIPAELGTLAAAVANTLGDLAAEDRFLLAAYYLDRQTLLEIARTLHVHEATISRRLKRLLGEVRKQLLRNLAAGGLSKAAAQEALGADPRDVEINLRALLQTSQLAAFQDKEGAAQPSGMDSA